MGSAFSSSSEAREDRTEDASAALSRSDAPALVTAAPADAPADAPAEPPSDTADDVQAALARADATRIARGLDAGSVIFYSLLQQKPFDSPHLSIRMRQPENWESLHLRHKQRDPAKGCIDPTILGTPEGRDEAEVTMRLPGGGERVLRLLAYTAHLVPPDTLWDPEAGDAVEGPIYEGGTWTGTLLWDSAVHATEWLLGSAAWAAWLPGRSVLELGCGLGLPGLACHALGAAPVLLTDRPPIADLVADGLALSGVAPPGVRPYSFEWDAAGAAAVRAELAAGGAAEWPDLILACDCIFSPLFGDAFLLLQMLDLLAGPRTVAIVALERRADDGAGRFFAAARRAGFAASPPKVESGAVLLFEMRRRAPPST